MMTHRLSGLFAAFALSLNVQAAFAQDAYPTRPVRIVVPYPPGGSTDPMARLIAGHLTASWGHQVVVDNRPGGDTIIGASLVAKAAPDGQTLLYHATTLVLLPLLHKHMPFDPAKELAPIATVATNEKLLVVHPSVPANTLQELITHAKANPGKLNFAMTATGSANHLANEMLNLAAGIRTTQVPYKGAGPALTDLMGGHVQRGMLRGIDISGSARLPALAKIPTFAEAGMPKLEVSTWQGLLAPARVPRSIVNKISKDVAQALAHRDTLDKFTAQGSVPLTSTPEQFAKLMREESARYARVIEAANIRL